MITFTGKVVAIEVGSEYTDGKPRARIRLNGEFGVYNQIQVVNEPKLALEQEVTITVTPVTEA